MSKSKVHFVDTFAYMNTLYSQVEDATTYDFLDTIFNNTHSGIAIINLDGQWLKVNDTVCDLLGYTRNELFNMNFQDIVYREDLGVSHKQLDQLIAGKIKKYQVEKRYFHKDGSIIWVLLSVSLVRDRYGEPSHVIWQLSDITERKNQEEKLKVMLNVAREQNERLTAFADIITHNLRSHSGNLITLTGFLEEDYSWLKENESFGLLQKAIENLEDTISHLTEVAKIKQIEHTKIEALNLSEFVEKAIYNITAVARNANATIINNVDPKMFVKGIPAYLDSIVLNFLTNAIKYRSDKRRPQIKLSSNIQNDYVIFNVADNGLGIDMHKYGDKLFQMYKTFHCNEDARGIGLFITKNHIESLGGKVIVTSEVDQGTEFSIYLKRT